MKKQNKQIRSVRRPAYTTRAFTLVELIVVITILAILWTIAFISLQWYSSQARDSKRLSDIQNIKKSLELFSLNTWKYPEPDDYFTVSYWSQELRYQWTVWEQVAVNLSRNLNEKPTDPLTENEYTYSRTYAWNDYELLSIYESDLISLTSPLFFAKATKSRQPSPTGEGARTSIFSSIFAANSNYPKINGNYNGVYVKAGTHYIPTPSIINANVWWDVDLAFTSNFLESQIITWWSNNIANAWIETNTWWLTWMSVEVFTWILDTDIWEDDYNNKEELAQVLIDAYSWTSIANEWVYKEIVETASEDLVSLVDSFVLNNDNFVNTTSSNDWWDIITDWDITTACAWANTWDVVYESTNSSDDTWLTCNYDIAVCSWVWTWYIISACNLWATTVWTTSASYGLYYQWWNNHGSTSSATTISTLAYTTWYGPWNYYSSTNFINWSISNRYDWAIAQNDKLWWNTTNTSEARQWPCPTWYHVPSQSEWSGIVTAWQWWTNWASMQTALKLPFAGLRSRGTGSFRNGGSQGYYWSSSPYSYNGYYLFFNSSDIIPSYATRRANGLSIRCFKN